MKKADLQIENDLKWFDQQFASDTKDLKIGSDQWMGIHKHYCNERFVMLKQNGKI